MTETTVESLMVEWRADTSKFQQDMNQAKQITKDAANEVKKTVNEAQNLTKEAAAAGGSLGGMGQQAVASATQMEGLTTALAVVTGTLLLLKKAAQGTWQSIQDAMDVQESERLFNKSMGGMADSTREWSEGISNSLGASGNEIRTTTASLFNMAQTMGMGSDAALGMSKNLTQLKYDLMSYYNLKDESQAENIVRGVITGDTVSAKKIGILLTDEAAKRALVTQGIIEEGQAVDKTALMYGRYLTMMEQAAAAHGDMAANIESPTNQLRVLQVELQELGQAWGQAFLPIAQTVIPMLTSLANTIAPIIQLIGSLNNMVFGQRSSKVLGGFSMNSIVKPTAQITSATKEGDSAWKSYGDSAAGATGKAKAGVEALRRSILGFDQIHKLVDPDAGAGGGGGGGVLGPGAGTGIDIPEIPIPEIPDVPEELPQETARKAIEAAKEAKAQLEHWMKENPVAAGVGKFFWGLTPQGALGLGLKTIDFMRSDIIPDYSFVPDDISEKTQEKLEPLLDVWHNTQAQIKLWAWGNQEITKDMAKDMAKSVSGMGEDINELIDADTQEQLEMANQFFEDNKDLTEERKAEILEGIKENGEKEKTEVNAITKRINGIYKTAANEHRGLTADEEREVSALMLKMRDKGIAAASDSSEEQQKIFNHLQEQASNISARQAADIVKSSLKAKNEAVAAANERYDKEIDAANRLHEAGLITDEEYESMVKSAKKSRDGAITAAEETHKKVVEEAKAQASEHVNEINWETGEVLTNWESLKIGAKKIWNDIAEWFKGIGDTFSNVWDKITGKDREVNEKAIPSPTQLLGPQGGAGLRPGNFEELYFPKKTTPTLPKSTNVTNQMKQYASGGSPEPGEVFQALEDGPEWIGTMGGRSVVANNRQIVEGISAGVFNAVSAAVAMNSSSGNNQPIVLYVGGNKLLDTVVEASNRESARTGKRVIHVGA